MKKTYAKPEIMFESFLASTSIARDCAFPTGEPTDGTCGIPWDDGVILFTSSIVGASGCTPNDGWVDSNGGDGEFNDICYYTPTGNTIFNS